MRLLSIPAINVEMIESCTQIFIGVARLSDLGDELFDGYGDELSVELADSDNILILIWFAST